MRNFILHNIVKRLILFLKSFNFGAYLLDYVLKVLMESRYKIIHNKIEFQFSTPNRLCVYRAKSFSEKEPETLEWIDNIEPGAVLWDIGANIGLYSVYAAKTRSCLVFAFEPSVFNLEFLARNIYMNNLSNNIVIIPLALSENINFASFRMTSTEWGGSLSSFKHDLGYDGKNINKVFEYNMSGVNMDSIQTGLNIPKPDYIKMDVDGIEHFILKGGKQILENVKGILIEVNDNFIEQASECSSLLKEAGLKLAEKKHSDLLDDLNSDFNNCYNQIWVR